MAPLKGINVIDFSRFLPGPYCTWLLADLGANVIRIEHAGEQAKFNAMLGLNRRTPQEQEQIHASHMYLRGKKNVRLDLADPEHCKAAIALIKTADVLVEDFRTGVMEDMGFGEAAMRALNPGLIYCSVSACGQTGPYAGRAGHEPIALALSGVLAQMGTAEQPATPGVPMLDLLTGSNAAMAVMAAIIARSSTGRGQCVDASMTDSAMPALGMLLFRSAGLSPIRPRGTGLTHSGIWRTRDGRFIATTDLEPRYWRAFCGVIGCPEYIDTPAGSSDWPAISAHIQDIMLQRDAADWLAEFEVAGNQYALLYDVEEAFADPHNIARGMALTLDGPHGSVIKQVGSPLHLSDTPVVEPTLPHMPGADTRDVLASIGMVHLIDNATV